MKKKPRNISKAVYGVNDVQGFLGFVKVRNLSNIEKRNEVASNKAARKYKADPINFIVIFHTIENN